MTPGNKNKESYDDFYHEILYNLQQDLKNTGPKIRTSVIKYFESEGHLKIIDKLGIFRCPNEEFVLASGEGLADKCFETGKIINIDNKNKRDDLASSETAIYLDSYIESKYTQ
jgi:hypothetical protein